jgi:hypothetical protein
VDADLRYALCVTGAGFFAWVGWWAFCFFIRQGIDGYRALEKFLLSKKRHKWRQIFIGSSR